MVQTLIKESEVRMIDNKKITEERIDEVVNDSFIKASKEISKKLADNISECIEAFKEHEEAKGAEISVGAMITAQNVCLDMVKEALKELLCD